MRPEELLTEKLIEDNVIEAENKEIILYGLQAITGNVMAFLVMLGIGACFGGAAESFILGCLIFPLRKNAGGYHAKTRVRCMMISAGILLLVFWSLYAAEWSMKVYMLIGSGFAVLIFLLAPIGNANKPLDLEELRVYRIRTRRILTVESAILFIAYIMQWRQLVKAAVMNFAIVGCALLAGKIKLLMEQKKEQNKKIHKCRRDLR